VLTNHSSISVSIDPYPNPNPNISITLTQPEGTAQVKPWRETLMRKKLATALLLMTLSAGIVGADVITPTRNAPSKQTTWQKIERIIQQVRNLWL
jgi:hypothetical protein